MTQRDDTSDTESQRTPDRVRSQPDPRIVALVRMLARRAAARDFEALLRRHGKAHRIPGRKDAPP